MEAKRKKNPNTFQLLERIILDLAIVKNDVAWLKKLTYLILSILILCGIKLLIGV